MQLQFIFILIEFLKFRQSNPQCSLATMFSCRKKKKECTRPRPPSPVTFHRIVKSYTLLPQSRNAVESNICMDNTKTIGDICKQLMENARA